MPAADRARVGGSKAVVRGDGHDRTPRVGMLSLGRELSVRAASHPAGMAPAVDLDDMVVAPPFAGGAVEAVRCDSTRYTR